MIKVDTDHHWHFQNKKSKGLIKDNPYVWQFVMENLIPKSYFEEGTFLLKCEGFGTALQSLLSHTLKNFGPELVSTLGNRIIINEINQWQINDIIDYLKQFETEFNDTCSNVLDNRLEFNYNNVIQGDARVVKFPLDRNPKLVILENQPYESKKTYEVDGMIHKNKEDAFAHDSIKLLKDKKEGIYISLRPATFNNLDKCEDIRSLYVGKISDIVKGNNGWFKEGIKQPLIIKYEEGRNDTSYKLWKVPNGLPPYNDIDITQETYTNSKQKIITGYPDSEDYLTDSILEKIRNYSTTFKSKGFEGKVGQGVGSQKSKKTLNKKDPLIVQEKTPTYSEPVVVRWKINEKTPQVWWREPKHTPLHDIKKSKVIFPRLMNQDSTRPINWALIDNQGIVGAALNTLLIHAEPDETKMLAEVITSDPFNACYSILRVGTSLSAEMLLSIPYIMSTDPDVWCKELGFTEEESIKFKNRCIKNKRNNPIYDYS